MIIATDVGVVEDGQVVLSPVSFLVEPGSCLCLHGPGSDALFALLTGGIKPSNGRLTVDGVDISTLRPTLLRQYRRSLGVVTRQPLLMKDRTLKENVIFASALRGGRGPSADVLLAALGIVTAADILPHVTSEETQRLAAIARALAGCPPILLLDEPFAGLGPEARQRVALLIRDAHAHGVTVMVLTDDPGDGHALGSSMIALGAGEVEQATSPAPSAAPATHLRPVAVQIDGSMNA